MVFGPNRDCDTQLDSDRFKTILTGNETRIQPGLDGCTIEYNVPQIPPVRLPYHAVEPSDGTCLRQSIMNRASSPFDIPRQESCNRTVAEYSNRRVYLIDGSAGLGWRCVSYRDRVLCGFRFSPKGGLVNKLLLFGLVLPALVLTTGCKRTSQIPNGAAVPTGPATANRYSVVTMTSSATDPDGDSLAIRFDWGDGDTSDWSAFLAGGSVVADSHYWSVAGSHRVRAQAKDPTALLSDWSQPLAVTVISGWSRTFGGTSDDEGFAVLQSADGGYVAAGATVSSGQHCVRLVKTDSVGNQEWYKDPGSNEEGLIWSVRTTSDGGYVLAGSYRSSIRLIKTNAEGNKTWGEYFGGPGPYTWATCRSLELTRDGGYILVGEDGGIYDSLSDVYVIKTDADGNQEWARTYGDAGRDGGWSVGLAIDGGYVIAGYAGDSTGGRDVFLLKIDSCGDRVWTKPHAGPGYDCGYSLAATADGGFVSTGYFEEGGDADICLIKTDADGNEQWTRTFGGASDDVGRSVQQTTDGGYIIAGDTKSFGAGARDVYLLKTDANGDTAWTRTFGGTEDEYGNAVRVTADGSYMICATTSSYGAGGEDIWLIKTDSQGNVVP
jgi:hypothetical protein